MKCLCYILKWWNLHTYIPLTLFLKSTFTQFRPFGGSNNKAKQGENSATFCPTPIENQCQPPLAHALLDIFGWGQGTWVLSTLFLQFVKARNRAGERHLETFAFNWLSFYLYMNSSNRYNNVNIYKYLYIYSVVLKTKWDDTWKTLTTMPGTK